MATRGRHVGITQHPRNLFYPPLTIHNRHITRRQATLLSLCDHEVLIGMHRDLRQVRNDERLPALARHIHQGFSHSTTNLAADALIDFIEYERRHDVVRRKHHLQRQHQARQFTARRNPGQRPCVESLVQLDVEDDVLGTLCDRRGA